MKVKDFIGTLEYLTKQPTVYYSKAGGDWARWNGRSWNFDCVILVKAILWGWNGDKKALHGGAKYLSNNVKDDTPEQLINRCNKVSSDFNEIKAGEVLWLPGHIGVYVGDGKVIEATAGWTGGVLVSNIDKKGNRTRQGKQIYKWQKHGELPYIEYEVKKSIDTIVDEVIALKWGCYPERKTLLENAGYNYRDIQNRVNARLKNNQYYTKPTYYGISIVEALKKIKVDSSYSNRCKIAKVNGIQNYRGTANQNLQMLSYLKSGKLKKA